ncbi:hypothetical protein AOG25_08055 [Vibrio alginolyticus]|nr:hypothetical protein AOG25_08055 [Vibrio alginolyticus]
MKRVILSFIGLVSTTALAGQYESKFEADTESLFSQGNSSSLTHEDSSSTSKTSNTGIIRSTKGLPTCSLKITQYVKGHAQVPYEDCREVRVGGFKDGSWEKKCTTKVKNSPLYGYKGDVIYTNL